MPDTPRNPVAHEAAALCGTGVADPILAAPKRGRINRPYIWAQAIRSDLPKTPCRQGAVHIWIPAFEVVNECEPVGGCEALAGWQEIEAVGARSFCGIAVDRPAGTGGGPAWRIDLSSGSGL